MAENAMDNDDDHLQLACESLKKLGWEIVKISTQNARRRSSDSRLGEIGSQLWMLATRLENPDGDSAMISPRRIRKLLSMVEKICESPSDQATPGVEYMSLRKIVESGPDQRWIEAKFRKYVSDEVVWSSWTSNLESLFPSQAAPPPRVEPVIEEHPAHLYDCLFAALKKCNECVCAFPGDYPELEREHKGSLGLRSHVQVLDGDLAFDTVFSIAQTHKGDSEREWRRLKVQVSKAMGKKQVAHKPCDDEKPTAKEVLPYTVSQGIDSQSFCRLLQEDHGPIHRRCRVVGENLSLIAKPIAADGPTLREHSITLAEALRRSRLTSYERLQLAHIVARSVWEYYESPWMCSRWTETSLHFVPASRPGKKERSWYGPFVPMIFRKIDDHVSIINREYLPDEVVLHRAPRVLALGVVLVKIIHGEASIEPQYCNNVTAILNAELVACNNILKEPTWDTLAELKAGTRGHVLEAISACFDTDVFSCDNLISDRRSVLLKRVVCPLEEAVSRVSPKQASAIWVSERSLSGYDQITRHKTQAKRHPRSTSAMASEVSATIKGSFYDSNVIAMDTQTTLGADRFMQIQMELIARRIGDINDPDWPVRIAILDTGIDRRHPNFYRNPKIIEVGSWTDNLEGRNVATHDDYGHGTHVAGIISTIAPHADLYIARIAKQVPEDPVVIAKALNHAVNEWNVDIIVMSFGFDSDQGPSCSLLSKAIRNAYLKCRLMFAASSNEGANQPRAFPARHTAVFGIHSTNGKGVPSAFNPLQREHDHNFSTLGEGVESAWPKKLSENPWMMRKSGSSYATPIAAGIAAFVLLYVRENLDAEAAEKVREFDKMKDILQATSLQSGGYEYISLDTMFGHHRNPATIEGDIREILNGTYRRR